jgi:hypothetical protein
MGLDSTHHISIAPHTVEIVIPNGITMWKGTFRPGERSTFHVPEHLKPLRNFTVVVHPFEPQEDKDKKFYTQGYRDGQNDQKDEMRRLLALED